ncbi:hypothetical protein ABK040_009775 [Willaertia magna]
MPLVFLLTSLLLIVFPICFLFYLFKSRNKKPIKNYYALQLCDDEWKHIFSFLNVRKDNTIALTSKHFKSLFYQLPEWKRLLNSLSCSQYRHLLDCERYKNKLSSIDLFVDKELRRCIQLDDNNNLNSSNNNSDVSIDNFLQTIIHFSKLFPIREMKITINMSNVNKIKQFFSLFQKFTKLNKLTIIEPTFQSLTEISMVQFMKYSLLPLMEDEQDKKSNLHKPFPIIPSLKSLKINGFSSIIRNETLQNLFYSKESKLEDLDLTMCSLLSDQLFKSTVELNPQFFKHLKVLSLNGCVNISFQSIALILTCFSSNLKVLDLSGVGFNDIDNNQLAKMERNYLFFPLSLQSLYLASCHPLIYYKHNIKDLKHLIYLDLSHNSITNEILIERFCYEHQHCHNMMIDDSNNDNTDPTIIMLKGCDKFDFETLESQFKRKVCLYSQFINYDEWNSGSNRNKLFGDDDDISINPCYIVVYQFDDKIIKQNIKAPKPSFERKRLSQKNKRVSANLNRSFP